MGRHWTRACLILALAAGLAVPCAAQDRPSSPAGPEGLESLKKRARRVGRTQYELGALIIDTKQRTIRCKGKVNMAAGGPIELLACLPTGKVHESVLTLDLKPLDLQVALLLLGLEPGRNPGVRYRQGSAQASRPIGGMVELYVEWQEKGDRALEARTVRHRAEDLLYNTHGQRTVEATRWVFVGSRWDEGRFGADMEGSVVSTYYDPLAILELPLELVNDDTWGIVNEEIVPPAGTAVELIVQAPPKGGEEGHIQLYTGYGLPGKVLIRGRALEDRPYTVPEEPGSRAGNLVRTIRLLESDELEDREVAVSFAGQVQATRTDEEGFFSVTFEPERAPFRLGPHPVAVRVKVSKDAYAHADGTAFVHPEAPPLVIVSDFDDTICHTGMVNKPKAGLRTLFGDPARMKPVEGMADFLRALSAPQQEGQPGAPIFYVSGGPANLHPRIVTFLKINDFPDGVLMLRNLGSGSDNDPWSVSAYKTARIESLMDLFQNSEFALIGDSGQEDATIYAGLRRERPQRVRAIMIRRAGRKIDDDLKDIIPFDDGADALEAARRGGLLQPVEGEHEQEPGGAQ